MDKVSVHDVAVALRNRLPGLGVKKQHKLLYYCQGHHLAVYGEPLFTESISAWDMGPVVGTLWYQERQNGATAEGATLSEKALNTIGYVVSRYGALSGTDLENLTHSETPWSEANIGRRPGTPARITVESIAAYFRSTSAGDGDDESTPAPDDETMARWLSTSHPTRPYQGHRDDPADLLRRMADLG